MSGRFVVLPPGLHCHRCRHSRAWVPAPRAPCPPPAVKNLRLLPQFPTARQDDPAFLLPSLYLSFLPERAATDVAGRAASREACAGIRAPAATRGETPAPKPVRLDAHQPPNPESLRRHP